MLQKIMVAIGTMFVTVGIIFMAAAFSSCTYNTIEQVNGMQERPTSRVAVVNVTYPRSTIRVTLGTGGALLTYLNPDGVDTVTCSVGDTLIAICGSEVWAKKQYFTPDNTEDTTWRVE